MIKSLIVGAINRRRVNIVQSVCSVVCIMVNLFCMIIIGNILLNTIVVQISGWHLSNIGHMADYDAFIAEKSEFSYEITIVICIIAFLFSFTMMVIYNRVWLNRLGYVVRLNVLLGSKRDYVAKYTLFEGFFDYILTLPFILLLPGKLWNYLVSNDVLSKVYSKSDITQGVNFGAICFSYCLCLLVLTIQNALFLSKEVGKNR